MISLLITITALLVAYANGANANFKGVASLYGSGTTSFLTAMRWAAVATAAGAVTVTFMTTQMLAAFSGKGLVADSLVADPLFLFSVAMGAMLTGGLATWWGFPVSTTHALTGGLLGAGLCANTTGVNFDKLWAAFFQPLLLGPVGALIVGAVLYLLLRKLGAAPDHRSKPLDSVHFLSAGAVCFARGMNDTPKMAALLVGTALGATRESLLLVALAMTAGGIFSARKVAETLAHKITDMNPGQGMVANLTTSILVILGTLKGLPLSTTHVTVGSLLGIGITTRQTHWRTAIPVLLAWVTTLPIAALLAAACFALSKIFVR